MIDLARRAVHHQHMISLRQRTIPRFWRSDAVTLAGTPACAGQGDSPPPRPDRVHAGSDDLLIWPPSTVELALATRWLDTGSPSVRDDLYLVAQSEDRAAAICEKTYIDRRAIAADELLARAFGAAPADRRR